MIGLAAMVMLASVSVAQGEAFVAPASPRVTVDLSGQWSFDKADAAGAEKADFDDTKWSKVTVPHTWNNLDGQDGRKDYYRGTGWYRRQSSGRCAADRQGSLSAVRRSEPDCRGVGERSGGGKHTEAMPRLRLT